MSLSIDRRRQTGGVFNLFGAPYVAEDHADSRSHLQAETDDRTPEPGIAVLWMLFYLVITGSWLVTSGAVGRAFEYAIALVK